MPARECYHCRQWIEEKQFHDCWTTTEAKLTAELSEDLMDAWLRLRETAVGFGEQRIYASHKSIMFSRKACYFFVRPQKNHLEICFFLGRTIKTAPIKKNYPSTKVKTAHLVWVSHRDEVETPLTDWLKEAYALPDTLKSAVKTPTRSKKKPVRKAKKIRKKRGRT